MMDGCADEKYYFHKAELGHSPCDGYDSCEECPYYKPQESEDE